jgi:hypothetical protein
VGKDYLVAQGQQWILVIVVRWLVASVIVAGWSDPIRIANTWELVAVPLAQQVDQVVW